MLLSRYLLAFSGFAEADRVAERSCLRCLSGVDAVTLFASKQEEDENFCKLLPANKAKWSHDIVPMSSARQVPTHTLHWPPPWGWVPVPIPLPPRTSFTCLQPTLRASFQADRDVDSSVYVPSRHTMSLVLKVTFPQAVTALLPSSKCIPEGLKARLRHFNSTAYPQMALHGYSLHQSLKTASQLLQRHQRRMRDCEGAARAAVMPGKVCLHLFALVPLACPALSGFRCPWLALPFLAKDTHGLPCPLWLQMPLACPALLG